MRYVLALTGPSGVGKSTVSRLLATPFGAAMAAVPILTTRGPKAGDDGEYRYVTLDEFSAMRDDGKLVSFTRIPSATEQRWYGYHGDDVDAIWGMGKLPIVITDFALLEGLAASYGRRAVLSFGLLPPGASRRARLSHLLFRLRHRGRETEAQIQERIRNAEDDLRHFEEHGELFNHLIVNDDLPSVVRLFQEYVPGLVEA